MIIAAMVGHSIGRHAFTKVVGMGSSLLEVDLALDTRSMTWLLSRVVKEERGAPQRRTITQKAMATRHAVP